MLELKDRSRDNPHHNMECNYVFHNEKEKLCHASERFSAASGFESKKNRLDKLSNRQMLTEESERLKHNDRRAYFDPRIKIHDIIVKQPDAAG